MARGEPRPGGGPPRPWLDAFLNRLARYVIPHLYRDIAVVGREHFPASGPVIVIANHVNSLVDGGLLLACLPRVPRFLAASTVWDFRAVAPFLDGTGAVRVHRRQDGRDHLGSLDDTFAEAAALLAAGGVLAVFPEGRSHDAPDMLGFKTGTARIAIQSVLAHAPLDLKIVPVGLDYAAKNRLRSAACIEFGAPVTAAAEAAQYAGADSAGKAEAVRGLTARLRGCLRDVAPDFATPREARALTVGGAILAAAATDRPPAFAAIVAARRRVQAGLARLRSTGPAQADAADAAERALHRYARLLDAAGLSDADTRADPGRIGLAAALALAVLGAPVLLVAALLDGAQALALWAVVRRKDRDKRMTWVTFGGLTLYLFSWPVIALGLGIAAGLVAGAGWGWAVGLGTLLAAPLAGRAALSLADRLAEAWRAARARRILRRPGFGDRLTARRAAASAAATMLAEAARTDGAAAKTG